MPTVLFIGANSGVGAACLELFATDGWRVFATYHQRRNRLDELLPLFVDAEQDCFALRVEARDDVLAASEYLARRDVRLDAIVTTASFNQPRLWDQPPLEIASDDIVECFAVEVVGLHNVVTSFWPLLNPGASIVAFSSASALHGDADTFTYNLSKIAVNSYVRMFGKRYGELCRINCIAPDSVATDWIADWNVSPEEQAGFRVVQNGQRRIGEPPEVARTVRFLCSSDASYLNGQTLVLDGGAG